jgi:pyruvate,orthophosphate dikinase
VTGQSILPEAPAPTDALRANLARTAVEVVIPEEHQVLLEISAPWFGVHQANQDLLREIHHRYVGWPQALADLHRRATSDLHRHVALPRGPEAIAVICDLYAKVVEEATPESVADDGLRLWLRYLEMVAAASGPMPERRMQAVSTSLAQLGVIFERTPPPSVGTAAQLKRLVKALLTPDGTSAGESLGRALGLLAFALDRAYRHWAGDVDPVEWYRRIAARPGEAAAAPPPEVELISRTRVEARIRELDSLIKRPPPHERLASLLLDMPDDTQVQHAYLRCADIFARNDDPLQGLQDQLHWLLLILGHERLTAVHEPALRQVSRCCSDLLDGVGGDGPLVAVREVFDILRGGGFPFTQGVQGLVGQIGRQALSAGDPDLTETLIDEILRLDFDYPEFSGFTPEWGVIVNPAHLRRIRTYLSIIEADPTLARPLIVGLVVHLKLGGVFIADTDLFQRDVSSLLGRPIGPVYLEIKQLLRLLPVYFNEIGAEGALRETSTRLDEMDGRRDPLCHLLRKQSHVECNPRLIAFAEQIARFWLSGDPTPLRRFVPDSVLDEVDPDGLDRLGLSEAVRRLADLAGGMGELLDLDPSQVDRLVDALADLDPAHREKAALLLRVRREIARKYELDHTDLITRLRRFRRLDPALVGPLEEALQAGEDEAALDRVVGILEALQSIILASGETQAYESIYRKRHIAAGIPSMYGSYHEERFEAMGLTFRAGSLASTLLARVTSEETPATADEASLRKVAGQLGLYLRALRIDGFRARGLEQAIRMLEEALTIPTTTTGQYLNIFQLTSHRIEDMIRARILDTYRLPIEWIVTRMVERGILPRSSAMTVEEAVLIHSETLLRDLVVESLGLQGLDALVGRTIRLLSGARRTTRAARSSLPDVNRCVVPLQGQEDRCGIVSLGNKGFMLRRLAQLGFRVPEGFILTTELFRGRGLLWGSTAARAELAARLRREVAAIERSTGLGFGDPRRPLLLSVRSGAAISMPGMLETFLNVGVNTAVVAGMAEIPGREWAAWDAYRRFLQMWGMSFGLRRELFDDLVQGEKDRYRVPRKSLLPADAMRDVALAYRSALVDRGVTPVDDPFEQFLACIELVHASWESERARLYREELHIAEEWGTAVTVQRMVFGNLGPRSGTGVLLTRHPLHESRALDLYGDFVIQSQGDDVVGGLVETFPITERQRRSQVRSDPRSLEADFPEIHQALVDLARRLVEEEGMNHQEVEFTFESDRRADLYLLQTRDTVIAPPEVVTAFTPSDRLEPARVAAGIGVGGGALSGRIAHSANDIRELQSRWPESPIILLRRDTVPEDVPLMLQVDGMLTSLGGATSHAAVAAKRLGKTCVVGCRSLDVSQRERESRLGGHRLVTGDLISIDGIDGSVYLGAHPLTSVRVGEGGPLPQALVAPVR